MKGENFSRYCDYSLFYSQGIEGGQPNMFHEKYAALCSSLLEMLGRGFGRNLVPGLEKCGRGEPTQ